MGILKRKREGGTLFSLTRKNTFKPTFMGIAEHHKKARKETVQGLTVQTAEGGVCPSQTLYFQGGGGNPGGDFPGELVGAPRRTPAL